MRLKRKIMKAHLVVQLDPLPFESTNTKKKDSKKFDKGSTLPSALVQLPIKSSEKKKQEKDVEEEKTSHKSFGKFVREIRESEGAMLGVAREVGAPATTPISRLKLKKIQAKRTVLPWLIKFKFTIK